MISPVMAEILRVFHAETTPRLSEGCVPALGMDQLTVSLALEGRLTEQLWSTDETSTSFEDLQFTVGEGPGPDAMRTGRLILEHDVSAVPPQRWPALLPAMARLPIQALFCLPLALGGITVGVLTALRSTPGPMTGQQMDDALALAAALTLRFLGGDGEQLVASVRPGTESHRAVVHQATGMLSVQLGLPLAKALLRLRAHAYGHDRSIIDVAQDVVARRLKLDDDRPAPEETRG
ncbi:GAF and ANTAR domain-containing protein [Streptomyces sp. NPDC057137]|uniref:GAF and ANTAR domain-containing protein n=1 Tax=Streptomyces sp. NPDC057137 TaxID=3346030 RepID=UPI003644DE21